MLLRFSTEGKAVEVIPILDNHSHNLGALNFTALPQQLEKILLINCIFTDEFSVNEFQLFNLNLETASITHESSIVKSNYKDRRIIPYINNYIIFISEESGSNAKLSIFSDDLFNNKSAKYNDTIKSGPVFTNSDSLNFQLFYIADTKVYFIDSTLKPKLVFADSSRTDIKAFSYENKTSILLIGQNAVDIFSL